MINSMTGFGSAQAEHGGESIAVEISTVNNRYVKIISKMPEVLYPFERDIEEAINKRVSRGTVYVSITIQSPRLNGANRIDEEIAASYIKQARAIAAKNGLEGDVSIDTLLAMPNIFRPEARSDADRRKMWGRVSKVLIAALEDLCSMRAKEGESLKRELLKRIKLLTRTLAKVRKRRPKLVGDYKKKFRDRLNSNLKEHGMTIPEQDVLREVALFSDRCDVAEEMCRMESHIDMFLAALDGTESPGRKIDFIAQEMLREVNTIGSKSNDAETTRLVVEMKTEVGKIKEQLQNLE
jgi:uncharacterized protein (TIGR00255 family)